MKYLPLALMLLAPLVTAQEAPTLWIPPAKTVAPPAFPVEVLQEYLATDFPRHAYRAMAGKNASLEKESDKGAALEVGAGFEIGADAVDLFNEGILEGETHVYLTALQSVDAYALRLAVDVAGLAPGEELWFIDPTAPIAFGPFSADSQQEGALWSPTVEGDTIILMLRSQEDTLPPLHVERASHFFRPLLEKGDICPIDVNCESDAGIQNAATAIGRLFITTATGGTLLCSGSLVNAPDTAEAEPYLISAQHCFRMPISNSALEVIWDYRSSECGGAAPSLSGFPRTLGGEVLNTDGQLDFAFLELSSVPNGDNGRAYLGYSLAQAVVGDQVLGIHHPRGTTMKLSYGSVIDIDQNSTYGIEQNKFRWQEGITEGGSSGSPALYRNSLLLMGVLSNGAVHQCGNPEQNVDNYSSFADYYPQIACYLSTSGICEEGDGKLLNCPAIAAFGAQSAQVAALRNFRDKVLAKSAWGQRAIEAYYAKAPALATAVAASPEVKAMFGLAAAPFVALGYAVH